MIKYIKAIKNFIFFRVTLLLLNLLKKELQNLLTGKKQLPLPTFRLAFVITFILKVCFSGLPHLDNAKPIKQQNVSVKTKRSISRALKRYI